MEQVTEDRFAFHVNWFDKQADLVRNYLLTFYPKNNDIEMVRQDFDRIIMNLVSNFVLCAIVRFEKQKKVPAEVPIQPDL